MVEWNKLQYMLVVSVVNKSIRVCNIVCDKYMVQKEKGYRMRLEEIVFRMIIIYWFETVNFNYYILLHTFCKSGTRH